MLVINYSYLPKPEEDAACGIASGWSHICLAACLGLSEGCSPEDSSRHQVSLQHRRQLLLVTQQPASALANIRLPLAGECGPGELPGPTGGLRSKGGRIYSLNFS